MLKRFSVVAFQTIYSSGRDHVEERGGGVCFIPIEDRTGWPSMVEQLVRQHFRRPLGRSLEVGVASLDEDILATICRRSGDAYWQGGDS